MLEAEESARLDNASMALAVVIVKGEESIV